MMIKNLEMTTNSNIEILLIPLLFIVAVDGMYFGA